MTTNFYRAYEIIEEGCSARRTPQGIFRRLVQHGLIAEEPSALHQRAYVTMSDDGGKPTWTLDGYFDYVSSQSNWIEVGMSDGSYALLDVEGANELAHTLIAAAEYSDQEKE